MCFVYIYIYIHGRGVSSTTNLDNLKVGHHPRGHPHTHTSPYRVGIIDGHASASLSSAATAAHACPSIGGRHGKHACLGIVGNHSCRGIIGIYG